MSNKHTVSKKVPDIAQVILLKSFLQILYLVFRMLVVSSIFKMNAVMQLIFLFN